MRYQEAVQRNLRHLGTPASEWTAVPVVGVEQVEGDRPTTMPIFEFPKNYDRAPSLYTGGHCCELCGTNIRNHYWIMHPGKRWLLTVGSECVTHFGEGVSGQVLTKEAQFIQNVSLITDLRQLRRALWKGYSKKVHEGYGRQRREFSRHSQYALEASRLHRTIGEVLGKTREDSGRSAISRWANRNREAATALLEEGRQLVAGDVNLPHEIWEMVRPPTGGLKPPSADLLESLSAQPPVHVETEAADSQPEQKLLL